MSLFSLMAVRSYSYCLCRLWLCICLFLFCPGVLALPAGLRVALFQADGTPNQLELTGPFVVAGPHSMSLPHGMYELRAEKSLVVLSSLGVTGEKILLREKQFELKATGTATGRGTNGIEIGRRSRPKRSFQGAVLVTSRQSAPSGTAASSTWHLNLINLVSRRQYLAAVVASEMPVGAPIEALKAQAVLANTQIAKLRQGETIDDSTQVQSYLGAPKSRPEAYAAVDQIGDQVVKIDGKLVQAFFHSTCAGMTSKPKDIFGSGDNLTYLTNVKCSYCNGSPFFKESVAVIPKARFETVFGAKLPQISARDVAGRPTEISYQFHGKEMVTNGYQFWLKLGQAFGWGKAPGTKFSIEEQNGEVLIKSSGAGHGVGLCQWGAIGMAKAGMEYRRILSFYLPGAEISK